MPLFKALLNKIRTASRRAWKFAFPLDYPTAIRKADGPESHLRKYLDYYRKLRAPGFAVLVTGEWGVGKTHQVLHALDEDQYFYISLYGLRTAEELRSAVFAQMFPSRHRIKGFVDDAKQAMRDASGFLAFGSLTPAFLGAFLDQNVLNDRVLVFDDLERSRIPTKVLLGVINHYVEHSGCRAIVIMHESKVLDSYFNDSKEKLFGQTLQAVPQVAEAFESFMKPQRGTKFGRFLAPFETDVVEIFNRSGASSLRLLKYLIEDLRRFHEGLDERHCSHRAAMDEAVKMLSVFSVEVRQNHISPMDLTDRAKSAYGEKDSKVALACVRYGAIDLTSTTLQDNLLTQMLVQGIYDPEQIRSSLDQSYHFLVSKEAPPWRTVINFDHIEDDKVQAAVEEMNKQIEELDAVEPGEMLHILALRLMMAEQGISGSNPDKAVVDAKTYINAMLDAGNIPPRPLSYTWKRERYSGHDGIGFWVVPSMQSHFKDIVEHLRNAQETALDRKLAAETPALLDQLLDGEKFYEKVVSTYTGNNPYAQVAILDKIEPQEFVAAWLKAPKKAWYWIGSAINDRYKASFQIEELRQERSWARQVVALLNEEASKLDGFSKFRLLRAIPKAVNDDDEEPVIAGKIGDLQSDGVEPAIKNAAAKTRRKGPDR